MLLSMLLMLLPLLVTMLSLLQVQAPTAAAEAAAGRQGSSTKQGTETPAVVPTAAAATPTPWVTTAA